MGLGRIDISDECQEFIKKTIPLGSNIIELGSGHGTRELVKNYKVYSIEQNKKWIGYVPESNYIYAPLKGNWYDPDIIKSNIPLKYSAILIDGPQGKGRMGFMENLSLFSLLNEVPIIIDDANRKITKEKLISQFQEGINKLQHKLAIPNIKYWIHNTSDGFYFHADYRRDLNYNYCKKVDYVMWGETDSFFPKEAFQAIETLSAYTDEQNIHKYILSFADRKMWDSSWDPLVHPKFEKLTFVDDDKSHLNPNQAKSPLSIKKMNEINSESKEFDFIYLKKPKIRSSSRKFGAKT